MSAMSDRVTEVTEPHTQLLRVTLEVENSRAYWQRVGEPEARSHQQQVEQAFADFWFGSKSMPRVRHLIAAFRARFGHHPGALEALHAWPSIDRPTRTVVCHWHLQLTDPIYRAFTADYLPARRQSSGSVTRDSVTRWMNELDVDRRWAPATRAGFASKLLSAAHSAGLVDSIPDPRALALPRVPAAALGYLMYLLRGVQFDGSLHANAYLRSVGLEGDIVDERLRTVAGFNYRRTGSISDFTWDHPTLTDWVRHTRARE